MINTLDLDQITKEDLREIINKISRNKCCLWIKSKYSDSKGYHVIINCLKTCDLCRFVFDDDKRFAVDSVMPLKFRDFLFNEKIQLGHIKITKENLNKIKEVTI